MCVVKKTEQESVSFILHGGGGGRIESPRKKHLQDLSIYLVRGFLQYWSIKQLQQQLIRLRPP